MAQSPNPNQLYRIITDQIAAAIAAGAPKFEMPWHRPALAMPANAATTRFYNGINVLTLWIAAQLRGFTTNHWATYRQWQTLGAQVRKGERACLVVFYKEVSGQQEEDVDDEKPAKRLVAKASYVFNSDQVENWHVPDPLPSRPKALVLDHAEQFVRAIGAEIHIGNGDACYVPHADYIAMPRRDLFAGSDTSSATEAYYATLFHELVHWTGHESRLHRDFSTRFGDEAYAMEELVAELGAAFLCAENEITNVPRPDHAAYVAAWLNVLGNDKRAIVVASAKASAAMRFLNERAVQAFNPSAEMP